MQLRIVQGTESLRNMTAEKERISTELNLAAKIQKGMLPGIFPPFPERKEFDLYASMTPARDVGGDFYDFFLIDEDHLALVIADVSGKGVPGALFMMVSQTILKNNAMIGKSVGEILAMTNDVICASNKMEMFVTVWMGILEISTGKIRAANAGHEYPALMKDGCFRLYRDRHSFVIGGMEGMRYREYELQLQKGEKLFLYTDGLPEATNAGAEMFGTGRMIEALNANAGLSPREILSGMKNAVDVFVGDAEPFDDLTMLCLEYIG
jgi:sigma-B regulation protein RsbU (phosphoserine phosphatase)